MADAIGDVVVNGHREWHRLLEDHADLAAQFVERIVRVNDVFAIQHHRSDSPLFGVKAVDAVEYTQQRRLAAARGPDQRSDLVFRHVQRKLFDGFEVSVVESKIPCRQLGRGLGFDIGGVRNRQVQISHIYFSGQ